MLFIVISSVFAYLLGSISTAVIVSEKLYGRDIRSLGSGNAGATNAMRTLGKKAAAIVFFCDFSKGLIAVAAAKCFIMFFEAPYETMLFAGFFVQFGHCFPVFFRFRGGKGVATAAGAALGVMPLTAVILLAFFAVIAASSKIVSAASGFCAALYPLLAYFLTDNNRTLNFIFAASCSVLIIIMHGANIARLMNGEEKPISTK